jgi:outer membrane receptor protein involved in Fe transport
MDDQNTESIPGHINLDAKLFREFGPLQVFVSGQNLTNFTYLQSKGNLSMGRFLLAGLGYKF